MKVLFVITNIDGFYKDTFSIGLASLMSYVGGKGYEYDVAIVNTRDEYSSVIDLIRKMKPKVVGYTSVSSQFSYVKELARIVKKEFGEEVANIVTVLTQESKKVCILVLTFTHQCINFVIRSTFSTSTSPNCAAMYLK